MSSGFFRLVRLACACSGARQALNGSGQEEKEISPVERGKVSPVLTRSARRRLVLTERTGNQHEKGTQKSSRHTGLIVPNVLTTDPSWPSQASVFSLLPSKG
jgi:hypothetical protein